MPPSCFLTHPSIVTETSPIWSISVKDILQQHHPTPLHPPKFPLPVFFACPESDERTRRSEKPNLGRRGARRRGRWTGAEARRFSGHLR